MILKSSVLGQIRFYLSSVELSTRRTRGRSVRCFVDCTFVGIGHSLQRTSSWLFGKYLTDLTNWPISALQNLHVQVFSSSGPISELKIGFWEALSFNARFPHPKTFNPFLKIKREIILKTEERYEGKSMVRSGIFGSPGTAVIWAGSDESVKKKSMFNIEPEVTYQNE